MSTILRSPGGISSGVATMYFAIWFAEYGEGQALALRSNERRDMAKDGPSLYVWVKSASKVDRVRVRYPKGFSGAIPV